MNINLVTIGDDGVIRLAGHGELTSEDFKSEANPLLEIVGDHWASKRVILNMSDVRYMDSAAMGWLMQSQKEFRSNGGRLVVYNVPPRVKQMFDLLKLSTLVPVANDEPDALNKVKEEGA